VTARSREEPEARGWLAAARWRLTAVVRDVAARLGLLDHLQRLRGLRANRRRASRARAVVPTILANIAAAVDEVEPGTWRTHTMLHTLSDVTVLTAGPTGQPFRALIKIAETDAAAEGLDWQRRTLTALHGDERVGDWRALLPHVLDSGETEGTAYLVENRLVGTSLEHALARPAAQQTALRAAADAVGRLHRATSIEGTVGAEILDRWVREPMHALGDVAGDARGTRSTLAGLAALSDQLHTTLEDQPVTLSWVHGDYAPNNILTGPDGQISGIVDWEFAHPEDFPSLDIVTLLLTARMFTRRQELGRVVCDLLATPTWTDSEAPLVAGAHDARACAAIGTASVVLLCWLRHVNWMLTRCTRYADSGLWIHANVLTVLDALGQGARGSSSSMPAGIGRGVEQAPSKSPTE
jgi:aminoglycoside phosphotransferase (APT) family kinase protein